MEKYKLCPGCGVHNNPLAIECENCGEDLSSVRILDAQTEEQLRTISADTEIGQERVVKMVRICEDCGAKNEPQNRKCENCGEDISMVTPTPDEESPSVFFLSSTDGTYAFDIPQGDEVVVIGREQQMQEYLKGKFYVSRRHAELSIADGKLQIRSLETATNGTHINGVQIPTNKLTELNAGDVVGLGGNDPQTQKEAAYFQVVVR